MARILRFLCFLFPLLLLTLPSTAQEPSGTAQTHTAEMERLRAQLSAQQKQIEELQQVVRQLQQKLEPPAYVSAGSKQPSAQAAGDKAPLPSTATRKSDSPGFGNVKFGGLIQGWFSAGDNGFRDTFRLRRAELKLTGEITPKARWTVMIDPGKALSMNNMWTTVGGQTVMTGSTLNQASRILQDAYVTLDYIPRVHLDFGQFKVPFSLEGLQSSATLETVERAMFASDRGRGGSFGDVRDLGVMIRGPFTKHVDYQFGLFNGSGESQNDLDKNDQKAVAGRLVLRPPFIGGLQLGGSGVWGGQGTDRPRRDRLGAELLFNYRRFLLKSEFMAGKDALVPRLGYYGLVGYKFHPAVQAVFRFDVWDPDTRSETSAVDVTERDYVAGINYFITEKTLKLQVNYMRKTFQNGLVPSRNMALVNLQTSW